MPYFVNLSFRSARMNVLGLYVMTNGKWAHNSHNSKFSY